MDLGKTTGKRRNYSHSPFKKVHHSTASRHESHTRMLPHNPTTAMEIESGLQPAWIRLQTKALSAVTRMQSLSPNHPIQIWFTQSIRDVRTAAKSIPHCSNLENLAREFPEFMTGTIEQIQPFTGPDKQPTQTISNRTQQKVTKQSQRQQIKTLAKKPGTTEIRAPQRI